MFFCLFVRREKTFLTDLAWYSHAGGENMTQTEAEKSYKKWKRWAATVRGRWLPNSPMYLLAERLEQEAKQRLEVAKLNATPDL